MAFDSKKFCEIPFKDRTETVEVPELKCFFGEEEPAEWVLKCISASEVATARDHVKNAKNKENLVNSLFQNKIPETLLNELKEKTGIPRSDGKVHPEVIFRKALLMFASVSPKCDETTALILAKNYPEIFDNLSNKALVLIGQGQLPGELNCSGETTA